MESWDSCDSESADPMYDACQPADASDGAGVARQGNEPAAPSPAPRREAAPHRCSGLTNGYITSLKNPFYVDHKAAQLDKAIQDGNIGHVKQILVEAGTGLNSSQTPPLCQAALEGHTEIAKLLIDCGADVNSSGSLGLSPLVLAARYGHVEITDVLLKGGAAVDPVLRGDNAGLYEAALHNQPAVVECLLTAGANVNRINGILTASTALHASAAHQDSTVVNLLLQANADVHSRTKQKKTALHFAAEAGCLTNVQRLLACGAHVDAIDVGGYTSLLRAVAAGHVDIVRALCVAGGSTNMSVDSHITPLSLAAKAACLPVMKLLIHFDANVNRRCYDDGDNILHTVILSCPHRASLNKGGKKVRKNAISINKEIEILDLLVQAGVDINAKNDQSETPLHVCVKKGCPAILDYLIKQGADCMTVANNDHTPLLDACLEDSCSPIIQLLVQHYPPLVTPLADHRRVRRCHVPARTHAHAQVQVSWEMEEDGDEDEEEEEAEQQQQQEEEEEKRDHIMRHLALTSDPNFFCMRLLLEAGYATSHVEAYLLRIEGVERIVRFLDEEILQPASLQRLSRTVLRRRLGSGIHRKLFSLHGIPQSVRDNIMLAHIFIPHSERDRAVFQNKL